jgi:hypothetical protein
VTTVSGPVAAQPGVNDDFLAMIDDMATRVWSCQRCLSFSHETKGCTNQIRCRGCYNYGHIRKNCLKNRFNSDRRWIPRQTPSEAGKGISVLDSTGDTYPPVQTVHDISHHNLNASAPYLLTPVSGVSTPSQPETSPPGCSDQMAAFEVDPTPWLPWGHQVIDGGGTHLPRSYYYPVTDPP